MDIIQPNDAFLPIEIKYGKINNTGLLKFMKKINIKRGIIITNNTNDTHDIDGKTITMIPAYIFLLKQHNHTEVS